MPIPFKVKVFFEALFLGCLVFSVIHVARKDHKADFKFPEDPRHGQWLAPTLDLVLKAKGPVPKLEVLQLPHYNRRFMRPLGTIQAATCPSSGVSQNLTGLCAYLTPLNQQGCCSTNPTDFPAFETLCTGARNDYTLNFCFLPFVAFWCNSACNPAQTSNTTCSFLYAQMAYNCSSLCSGLSNYLPTPATDNNGNYLGNATTCNYSQIPLGYTNFQLQYTGSSAANAINNGTRLAINNIVTSPTVYFWIQVTGQPIPRAKVEIDYTGTALLIVPVRFANWTYQGNNTWGVNVTVTIDISLLYAGTVVNLTVSAYDIVNYQLYGTGISGTLNLDLVISAPLPPPPVKINMCLPVGDQAIFYNGYLSNSSNLLFSSIDTLNCYCGNECDILSPTSSTFSVSTAVLKAALVYFQSFTYITFTTMVTLSGNLLSITLSGGSLTFQGILTTSNDFSITSYSLPQTVAFSGAMTSLQNSVQFSSVSVVISGGLTLASNAATKAGSRLMFNSCNATISSTGFSIADNSSGIDFNGGPSSMLTIVGAYMAGQGVINVNVAVVSLINSGILPILALTANSSFYVCGAWGSKIFTGRNVMGTIDLSCITPTFPFYSFYFGTILTPIEIHAGLVQLLNVSTTAKPVFFVGAFLVQGTLSIGFVPNVGPMLFQPIVSYPSFSWNNCSGVPANLTTYVNPPTVDVLTLVPLFDALRGLCNVTVVAAMASKNYTALLKSTMAGVTPFMVKSVLRSLGYSEQIIILAVLPNPLTVVFQCVDVTRAFATALCDAFNVDLTTPNSKINLYLNISSSVLGNSNVSVKVTITTLPITDSITNFVANLVVTTSFTTSATASSMVLASAAILTLSCVVSISYSYAFTGASDSTVAFSGSSSSFTAPVIAFSGPSVSFSNSTVTVASGSSLVLNSTSKCTISNSAVFTLSGVSTTFVISSSTATATVLQVIGAVITGSGRLIDRKGVVVFVQALIQVLVFLSYSNSTNGTNGTRQASSQATVTSCGDVMSVGFTFGSSQTQLTVDESCSVPTYPSYASYINGGLNVVSGSTLQLNNVSNTSRPLYVNGTVSIPGYLIVVFSNTSATLIAKTVVSFPTTNSSLCVTPANQQFTNSPTNISFLKVVGSYNSTLALCNLNLAAAYVSPTYSLGLNKDISTFTASVALNIFASVGYNQNLINIISITPATVLMTFNCLGPDQTTASQYCLNLYNTAMNPYSTLALALGVIPLPSSNNCLTYPALCSVGRGTTNKNGLLGLIALIAIIPIAIVIYCLCKKRTGKADEERLADIQTAKVDETEALPPTSESVTVGAPTPTPTPAQFPPQNPQGQTHEV